MNLKEVKQRILSVKGTQKITRAMKLVASAKLRRAQHQIEGMRPYQRKLDAIMSALLHCDTSFTTPYAARRDVRQVVIVAVASDTSLCGAFNSNVIRLLREAADEYGKSGAAVKVFPVGQKMHDAVKRIGLPVDRSLMAHSKTPVYNDVAAVANTLMLEFCDGNIDRVEIVYTRFASASRHVPVREPLLPFDAAGTKEDGEGVQGFIVEPGREELLQALLPKVISLQLYTALLDSLAAEHAARMIAMQTATDNADEMIAALTLEYNKGRQQAITNELLDIVAGSVN